MEKAKLPTKKDGERLRERTKAVTEGLIRLRKKFGMDYVCHIGDEKTNLIITNSAGRVSYLTLRFLENSLETLIDISEALLARDRAMLLASKASDEKAGKKAKGKA